MGLARIVGGAAITPFEHNWVSLLYSGGYWCGASLLNSGWALTAAHCTLDVDVSNVYIGVHRHAHSLSDDDEHECRGSGNVPGRRVGHEGTGSRRGRGRRDINDTDAGVRIGDEHV